MHRDTQSQEKDSLSIHVFFSCQDPESSVCNIFKLVEEV